MKPLETQRNDFATADFPSSILNKNVAWSINRHSQTVIMLQSRSIDQMASIEIMHFIT